MYVACITYMRHTQNNSLSSYFGFFMLSSSINFVRNHLNYLNILIDIYDKSGISINNKRVRNLHNEAKPSFAIVQVC
jgi:hypothetical protein